MEFGISDKHTDRRGVTTQHCHRLRIRVGEQICKACGLECQHSLETEDTIDDRTRDLRKQRENAKRERFHIRRRALRMVERDLYNRDIYAVTGFPVYSDSERKANVPSAKRLRMAEESRKKRGRVVRPKLGRKKDG